MRPAGKLGVSGALAGLACGLFGGGGGMVLAPLLTRWCHVEEKRVFANCVAVIFPLCALLGGRFPAAHGAGLRAGAAVSRGRAGRRTRRWGSSFRAYRDSGCGGFFALFLLYGGVRYLL